MASTNPFIRQLQQAARGGSTAGPSAAAKRAAAQAASRAAKQAASRAARAAKRAAEQNARRAASTNEGDAIASAGQLLAGLNSGDQAMVEASRQAVRKIIAAAAKDPRAKRAVAAIQKAQSAGKAKGAQPGFLVTNKGRVLVGVFVQVG